MKNLETLSQYFIDRDLMVSLFSEFNGLLEMVYDGMYGAKTDYFKLFREGDEYYIIHLDSGTMINWYKHIGRTNTCNKDLTIDEYREFLRLLYEDLKEN